MKNSNCRLSIIIPIYNSEKYLDECLVSISAQTFKNFEVIMVDDGSSDLSENICKKYKKNDGRFKYYKKDNGGPYAARLFGVKNSVGEYIMFCDSDDFYCDKRAFSKLFELLDKNDLSVIQFAFTKKYNHIKRKSKAVKSPIIKDRNSFLSDEYPMLICSRYDGALLTHQVWNKIYDRDLFLPLLDDVHSERIFWGDDQIINMQILQNCRTIMFIPDDLYCYRCFSGGTNNFSKRTMDDLSSIKKYQLLFLENFVADDKEHLLKILHAETAGWSFAYIREAVGILSEDELEKLIEHMLKLPGIVAASEYYKLHTEEKWTAVELLREADARKYIMAARSVAEDTGVKKSAVKFFKNILKRI